MRLFISALSRHAIDMYRKAEYVSILCTLHTLCCTYTLLAGGPCQGPADRKSRSPLTPSFRRGAARRGAACSFLFSATRFATTGPKKSLPRNLRRDSTDVNLSGSSDCSSNCGHCCENHVTGRVSWLSNLAATDGDLIAAKGLRQR